MKKVTLGCVLLLTACSGDASETPSQAAETNTAQQAIALMEAGDHEAMKDCDAIAAACESNLDAAEHCEHIVEHCDAFDGFLRASRGPAKSCWQGCMGGACDLDECRGMSRSHDDGRRRGLECLDEISACAPGDCDVDCGVDFDGPFSRGHGGPPRLGSADVPEGAGGGWSDGDAGEWPEGEAPSWSEDDGRPDGAGPARVEGEGWSEDDAASEDGDEQGPPDFAFDGDAGADRAFER